MTATIGALRERHQGGRGAPVLINRVSRLMGERRLSIEDVARGAGLARRTVHDLYHDKSSRIDLETLNKLCAFFDVDTQQILEWQRGDYDPPAFVPAPAGSRRPGGRPLRPRGGEVQG